MLLAELLEFPGPGLGTDFGTDLCFTLSWIEVGILGKGIPEYLRFEAKNTCGSIEANLERLAPLQLLRSILSPPQHWPMSTEQSIGWIPSTSNRCFVQNKRRYVVKSHGYPHTTTRHTKDVGIDFFSMVMITLSGGWKTSSPTICCSFDGLASVG